MCLGKSQVSHVINVISLLNYRMCVCVCVCVRVCACVHVGVSVFNILCRYLVTSADTPTILYPGFYFNALHVAVTKNQLHVCQELFWIIDSVEFLELVYPMDSNETREMRKNHLVDMYLNRQTGRPGAIKQVRA